MEDESHGCSAILQMVHDYSTILNVAHDCATILDDMACKHATIKGVAHCYSIILEVGKMVG